MKSRLDVGITAAAAGALHQDEVLITTIKDGIALHLVPTPYFRRVHEQSFVDAMPAVRREALEHKRPRLSEEFRRRYGLEPAGNEALDVLLEAYFARWKENKEAVRCCGCAWSLRAATPIDWQDMIGDRTSRSEQRENSMAQKVVVELVDDLDGTSSKDIDTVRFGLDGVDYEIDLTDVNAENLRSTLEPFLAAGRRTGGRIKRAGIAKQAGRPSHDREQTKAIREWARRNGFELAERGRIAARVVEAFENAQTSTGKPKARKSKTTPKERA